MPTWDTPMAPSAVWTAARKWYMDDLPSAGDLVASKPSARASTHVPQHSGSSRAVDGTDKAGVLVETRTYAVEAVAGGCISPMTVRLPSEAEAQERMATRRLESQF